MKTLTKNNGVLNLMPSLFADDFFTPNVFLQPRANIEELDDRYLLSMELPGYSKENLNIEYKKNYLIISSSISNNKEEDGKNYSLKEINKESFQRRFYFDASLIDVDNIEATFTNGILDIVLFKTQKQLKRLIQIK